MASANEPRFGKNQAGDVADDIWQACHGVCEAVIEEIRSRNLTDRRDIELRARTFLQYMAIGYGFDEIRALALEAERACKAESAA